MSATYGNASLRPSGPCGVATVSMLLLVGCVQDAGLGVGAGVDTDMEYVPQLFDEFLRYPARFICGEVGATQDPTIPVNDTLVPAIYRTLINATNVDTGEACFDFAIIPTVVGDDVSTLPLTPGDCLEVNDAFNKGIDLDCRFIRGQLAEHSHPLADAPFVSGTLLFQFDAPGTATVSTTITGLHKQVHANWLPDLIPKSGCDLVDGALQVTILNQGEGQALDTTTTQIEIIESPSIDGPTDLAVDTDPLDPSQSILLPPVPLQNPDADKITVHITADAGGIVEETDETNNELSFPCQL